MTTSRIEINPAVMMGKPVIRGTRITVEMILGKLTEGTTEAKLLEDYPCLAPEDVRAAIAHGTASMANGGRPTTRLSPDVAAQTPDPLVLAVQNLEERIEQLSAEVRSKRKDLWDKVQIVLMPLVIAVTGAAVSILVNAQQQKNATLLADAQTQATQVQELAKLVAQIPPAKDFMKADSKNRVIIASLESYGSRAVPILISLFQGTSYDLRLATENALIQIGDPAIPALVEALKSLDPDIRKWSLMTLGEMKTNQVVPIIKLLKSDEEESIREQAAYTLGELQSQQAAVDLVLALGDASSSVRSAAATALAQMHYVRAVDKMMTLADTESDETSRRVVLIALIELAQPNDLKKLFVKILAKDPNSMGALEALPLFLSKYPDSYTANEKASLCSRALEVLPDPIMAVQSVDCLEKVGDQTAVDALIDGLQNENALVSTSSAEALGKLRSQRAVDPLIGCIWSDQKGLTIAALKALGQIGDRRAIGPIQNVLKNDPMDEEIEAAKYALRIIKFQNSASPLLRAPKADRPTNRQDAKP